MKLAKRHRKSLEALRAECDYEDNRVGGTENFVIWEQLLYSHGAKTRGELVKAGYAVAGPYRWSDQIGHRITDAGRKALRWESRRAGLPNAF